MVSEPGGAPSVGAAGAAGEDGAGGIGVVQPDEEPPTVVSISPELGEGGVASDAKVEITFSEPMDKVATQAAFQSANLGGVTFDWPSDDVLVVTPNAPLAYATGTSLSVMAKTYGFSVTTAARDEAGNALKTATTSEFTTLRELTMIAPRVAKYYEYDNGTSRSIAERSGADPVLVGDYYHFPTNNHDTIRALIVFGLGALPIGIEGFLSASLSVSVCCSTGNPAALGGIHVDHIHLLPVTDAMTDFPPLSSVGLLSAEPSNGTKTMDVLAAVEDAYEKRAARNQQLQLRFQFEPATNNDDSSDNVALDKADGPDAAHISATFLIP